MCHSCRRAWGWEREALSKSVKRFSLHQNPFNFHNGLNLDRIDQDKLAMFQAAKAILFFLMLPSGQVVHGCGKNQTFYIYKYMGMLPKRFTFRKKHKHPWKMSYNIFKLCCVSLWISHVKRQFQEAKPTHFITSKCTHILSIIHWQNHFEQDFRKRS